MGQSSSIAVTGATGFIGKRLLKYLSGEGYRTRSLHRSDVTNFNEIETEWIKGDIENENSLSSLFRGTNVCINLAGATTAVNTEEFHSANVKGVENLVSSAEQAGLDHFIHISSQAAKRPHLSDYAASKAAGEEVLSSVKSNMKISVIRPPAVIGLGDPMLKPLFGLMKRGWMPAPAEPKTGPRKFATIDVDDLVSEIVSCVEKYRGAEIQEPCSVSSITWSDIASAASEVRGKRIRVVRIGEGTMRTYGKFSDYCSKILRKPLSISSGKVRELLTLDWTSHEVVSNATPIEQTMAKIIN